MVPTMCILAQSIPSRSSQLSLLWLIRLTSKGRAIDQKQHAAESASLDEPVDQAQRGPRLARTGGHRKEHVLLARDDPILDGLDGRLRQRSDTHEPLIGQIGLDDAVGAITARHHEAMRDGLGKQALRLEVLDNAFTRLVAIRPR